MHDALLIICDKSASSSLFINIWANQGSQQGEDILNRVGEIEVFNIFLDLVLKDFDLNTLDDGKDPRDELLSNLMSFIVLDYFL